MARLIQGEKFEEGEIINKWIYNRMIKRNKNILTAATGPTGSAKSYQDLRRAESWYEFYFKEKFPIKNVCFSLGEIMKRLTSEELRKGEILILEEGGANLGSLDFQNKLQKMFTYVLQSFRSMNVGIYFNLPYLTMLNKQARTLIHVHFQTGGINFTDNTSQFKAFFRQINAMTGKVYNKHFRVKVRGRKTAVKKFTISLPSEELINAYEKKKLRFVNDLTQDYSNMLDEIEIEKNRKMERKELNDEQQKVYELACKGLNQREIAERLGKDSSSVCTMLQRIKKYGYGIEIEENPKENGNI